MWFTRCSGWKKELHPVEHRFFRASSLKHLIIYHLTVSASTAITGDCSTAGDTKPLGCLMDWHLQTCQRGQKTIQSTDWTVLMNRFSSWILFILNSLLVPYFLIYQVYFWCYTGVTLVEKSVCVCVSLIRWLLKRIDLSSHVRLVSIQLVRSLSKEPKRVLVTKHLLPKSRWHLDGLYSVPDKKCEIHDLTCQIWHSHLHICIDVKASYCMYSVLDVYAVCVLSVHCLIPAFD